MDNLQRSRKGISVLLLHADGESCLDLVQRSALSSIDGALLDHCAPALSRTGLTFALPREVGHLKQNILLG